MLNVDREDAERILNMGSNLFVTGNAGAGKTYLIKEFAKNSDKNVALCATTGIAALNLGFSQRTGQSVLEMTASSLQ